MDKNKSSDLNNLLQIAKSIASQCDMASTLDHRGFSRAHAHVGHFIASQMPDSMMNIPSVGSYVSGVLGNYSNTQISADIPKIEGDGKLGGIIIRLCHGNPVTEEEMISMKNQNEMDMALFYDCRTHMFRLFSHPRISFEVRRKAKGGGCKLFPDQFVKGWSMSAISFPKRGMNEILLDILKLADKKKTFVEKDILKKLPALVRKETIYHGTLGEVFKHHPKHDENSGYLKMAFGDKWYHVNGVCISAYNKEFSRIRNKVPKDKGHSIFGFGSFPSVLFIPIENKEFIEEIIPTLKDYANYL